MEFGNDSQKLKVCEAMAENLAGEDAEMYQGNRQGFINACMAGEIRLVDPDEDQESRTLKLAESITKMADSLDELLKTGINRKLLVLFIQDKIGRELGKTKIELVLEAIEEFITETRSG